MTCLFHVLQITTHPRFGSVSYLHSCAIISKLHLWQSHFSIFSVDIFPVPFCWLHLHKSKSELPLYFPNEGRKHCLLVQFSCLPNNRHSYGLCHPIQDRVKIFVLSNFLFTMDFSHSWTASWHHSLQECSTVS